MRHTPTTIERLIAAGLIITVATACAAHRAPSITSSIAPASRAAACTLVPASAPHLDTITVALTHDVDPSHAPVPQNESERVLFAQLYEPLIRVDCLGQPYPGLAESWRADSSGRRWTFTLRDDSHFWDGTPVTSRDVAASWAARASSMDTDAASLFSTLFGASVQIDDARTLTIILSRPHPTVPLWLARPELAVVKRDQNTTWPQGTGAYRIDDASSETSRGASAPQRTIDARASTAAGTRVLRFRLGSSTDARDLLDAGIDVLMTSAPAVLEYAATRPDFIVAPLPWDRTYVLLSPTRVEPDTTPADSAFRAALARDAVRAQARASVGPYWWDDTSACTDSAPHQMGSFLWGWPSPTRSADVPPAPLGASPSSTRRIVYPQGDRVARDLADRLVALASLDARSSPRAATLAMLIPGIEGRDTRVVATGLPAAAFASALRDGHDLAYVFPMPHRALPPCALAHAVVPLIDTRSSLIVRRGVSPVAVDWKDTPLFAAPPDAAPPPTEHRP